MAIRSNTAVRSERADLVGAQLQAIEAEQRHQARVLNEILRLLEQRGRGPRDSCDAAVVSGLARVFGSRTFTAKEAVRCSHLDPELRRILEGAGVQDDARSLGWLLRELSGVDVTGLRVTRVRASHAGHRWQIVVSQDSKPAGDDGI